MLTQKSQELWTNSLTKSTLKEFYWQLMSYLLTKPANSSAKADEVGIRITKTIVNELVKIKRDEIWEYYGGVDAHMTQDVYIKKWIEIILMSLSGGEGVQRPKTASDARTGEYTGGLSSEDNEQIKSIIQENSMRKSV